MASVVTTPAVIGFRYRLRPTNRKTWLKSKKIFNTFEGASQAADRAADVLALTSQHRVQYQVLAETESQE